MISRIKEAFYVLFPSLKDKSHIKTFLAKQRTESAICKVEARPIQGQNSIGLTRRMEELISPYLIRSKVVYYEGVEGPQQYWVVSREDEKTVREIVRKFV